MFASDYSLDFARVNRLLEEVSKLGRRLSDPKAFEGFKLLKVGS